MSDQPTEQPRSLPLVLAEPRGRRKPPRHLADLTAAERKDLLTEMGLPGFRAKQVATHYFSRLADDPDQPPVEREISRLDNAIDKVVVSDSLTDANLGPWTDTTDIVRRANAHEAVAELRARGVDIALSYRGSREEAEEAVPVERGLQERGRHAGVGRCRRARSSS